MYHGGEGYGECRALATESYNNRTRRHLLGYQFKTDRRRPLFAQWIVNSFSLLPEDVVETNSIGRFKWG